MFASKLSALYKQKKFDALEETVQHTSAEVILNVLTNTFESSQTNDSMLVIKAILTG